MEQIKILEVINQWGYLDTYQISLLLKKSVRTTDTLLRILQEKKLILVNQDTRKNIYFLSPLGNRRLGKESKKRRLLLNELKHQDITIKWLCKQSNIVHYENELELKRFNSKKDKYPDLTIEYENGTKAWVEIERTRKSKERIEDKLDNMREHIKDGHKVIWIVPNKEMANFIKEQINEYNWNNDNHIVEIFSD
ncbi:hypothetical protein [Spiroplasma sp. AdecLV25b]|uniref:hypothetical protein n=1 Tax=Spiroplasma sp. AdecLV25b TaxID=3027162 RepID=UPI0027E08BAC|nr:hypothetical protein [Spiroplasma sp. AdecLV25b]